MYIILAILLFGVLIFVHELGHFITAKLLDVQVNEFSICMGPVIAQKQVGETTYSLRCIPIGGFCAMEGEDEQTRNPRAFTSKRPWRRFLILIAGSASNFIAGLLILVILYGVAAGGFATATIDDFYAGCPLESAEALQVGDEIVRIDGHRVLLYSDIGILLSRSGEEVHDLTVRRDGALVQIENLPMEQRTYVVNGEETQLYGFHFASVPKTMAATLQFSWRTALNFGRLVIWGLQDLISGAAGFKDLSGPVGIVSMVSESGHAAESTAMGVVNVCYFCAFLAVNLAFMNMLPIPALDGGRVFFLIITTVVEKLSRRRVNPKYEGYIHAAGMALLLAFMAAITLSDITKLIVR